MSPFAASLVGVLGLTGAFGLLVAKVEKLGFLQPRTTRGISASAQDFCTDRCRTAEGQCPLTHSAVAASDCPLWKYISADVPVAVHGSPFTAAA